MSDIEYALDVVTQAAGIDPHSREHQLGRALARADGDLMETLRLKRISKGLSVEYVAERMRCTVSEVRKMEYLGSDPHMSMVRRYANALGVLVTHQVTEKW